MDIIIGTHSIAHALHNKRRTNMQIVCSAEGIAEMKKRENIDVMRLSNVDVQVVDSHDVQERAKKIYRELGYEFTRVPSHTFLLTDEIEPKDVTWLYDGVLDGTIKKILCLDSVTDVHNAAAIMRTAAFYGVDALVTSVRGNFGMGPNFSRIASGALEYVPIVNVGGLPKTISKLNSYGCVSIGFSEHEEAAKDPIPSNAPVVLIMGAEDVGISNALMRVVSRKVAFKPQGEIQSLNVSVAAAIAMERYFSAK